MDWLIEILRKPDTWTLIFGGIGTAGAAAATYLVKKLGWKLVFSFKPKPSPLGQAEINELIEQKLKESTHSKDYETLKENHFQLKALFDVSKSQWEEKIFELATENEQLKAALLKPESESK